MVPKVGGIVTTREHSSARCAAHHNERCRNTMANSVADYSEPEVSIEAMTVLFLAAHT